MEGTQKKRKELYLTLQNGTVFQGYAFGASGTVTGELVFSTSMVGYMETLTDPANYGQIVVQTFPLIGNYGAITADAESDRAWVSAYVVREICDEPSNFRSEGNLASYLEREGVVGICGVDTRALTKILRENGEMNACISEKPLTVAELIALSNFKIRKAVQTVAPKELATYGEEGARYTVALWNFGAKRSFIESLTALGCRVISLPATATAEEILALGADGAVLSDGPGNPKELPMVAEELTRIIGRLPVFGVGLGHQLVALALGADVVKQKYGHRGGNQPVKCKTDGRVYVTTQNHGYEVLSDTVRCGTAAYVNVNDGSCDGIVYPAYKALTVQFSPDSCTIGEKANPVYGSFLEMLEKEKENA